MAEDSHLTREAFDYLAQQAGLHASSTHMQDLYLYVREVLAGIASIRDLDVAGAEPDMVFVPPRD